MTPKGLVSLFALALILLACGTQARQDAAGAEPSPAAGLSQTPNVAPTPLPAATPLAGRTPVQQTPSPEPPSVMASIYLRELYQGKPFGSADEWAAKLREWEDRRPDSPGFTAAIRGALIGLRTSEQLNRDASIFNDKWKHCVVGFEIALAVGLPVGEYAAWSKEHQDLTDGELDTSFDEEDYDATVDGARQADRAQESEEREGICEERWGDRSAPWDGTRPRSNGLTVWRRGI